MCAAYAITAFLGPEDTADSLALFVDRLDGVHGSRPSWQFCVEDETGDSCDLLFADLGDLLNFKLAWPHGCRISLGSHAGSLVEIVGPGGWGPVLQRPLCV